MKILQIGKFYYPEVGGIETVVRNLSEGLQRSGHSVTVACSSGPASGSRRSSEEVSGIRVERAARLGTLASQPLCPGLAPITRKLALQSDLLHVHSPHPIAEAIAMKEARGRPIVISYHSDVVKQRLLLPFYEVFLKRLLTRASAIVCASENHVRFSPYLPEFESKCHVIPYGIDFSRLKAEASIVSDIHRKHGQFGLFVGRLVPYKGVRFLIEAVAKTKVKVVIVGDGPLKGELEAHAAELGVADRVHFAGTVGNTELSAYYQAAEYLVLPSISRAEAFGVVMAEAMSLGKPVISTELPSGVVQVNLDQVTGLQVAPEDPEALAKAMTLLHEDPELRARLGQAAAAHVHQNFSIEQMVRKHVDLYARLLKF